MRKVLSTTLVLALVVLAGCTGAGGPGTTTTATTTDEPAERPPGVTDAGVTDPATLLKAHSETLAETSYTLTSTRTEVFADGDLRQRVNETSEFDADRTRYRTVYAVEGSAPSVLGPADAEARYWSNGSVSLRALTADGNTTYAQTGRADFLHQDHFERLYILLSVTNTTTSGTVTEDGQTYYQVNATAVKYAEDISTIDGASNVSDVEFGALVAPSGVVHAYDLTYTVTVDGERVTVEEHVEFTNVGTTTVEKPEWAPAALNATA